MEQKRILADPKNFWGSLKEAVIRIVVDPAGYFREMERSGGYADPFIFAVCMGLVAGIIHAVVGLVGFGGVQASVTAISSLIIVPLITGILTFIFAGVLFVVWKLMGSGESYEVSFRCAAYSLAISPITAVLNLVPYIGPIVGLAWMTYILVAASTEVHGIQPKIAWIVFGAICALLAVSQISLQMAARGIEERATTLQNKLGDIDKMNPEDAGKAVGEFLKGMEKGMKP